MARKWMKVEWNRTFDGFSANRFCSVAKSNISSCSQIIQQTLWQCNLNSCALEIYSCHSILRFLSQHHGKHENVNSIQICCVLKPYGVTKRQNQEDSISSSSVAKNFHSRRSIGHQSCMPSDSSWRTQSKCCLLNNVFAQRWNISLASFLCVIIWLTSIWLWG